LFRSITNPDLLEDVFRGADGIFHQAAIPSVPCSIKNPVAIDEVNVHGTLRVLVAAKESGVKNVVSRIVAASAWGLCLSS